MHTTDAEHHQHHAPRASSQSGVSPEKLPHCGESTDIFRHGGGEQMSRELGVPFLAAFLSMPVSLPVMMRVARSRRTNQLRSTPKCMPPSPRRLWSNSAKRSQC